MSLLNENIREMFDLHVADVIHSVVFTTRWHYSVRGPGCLRGSAVSDRLTGGSSASIKD